MADLCTVDIPIHGTAYPRPLYGGHPHARQCIPQTFVRWTSPCAAVHTPDLCTVDITMRGTACPRPLFGGHHHARHCMPQTFVGWTSPCAALHAPDLSTWISPCAALHAPDLCSVDITMRGTACPKPLFGGHHHERHCMLQPVSHSRLYISSRLINTNELYLAQYRKSLLIVIFIQLPYFVFRYLDQQYTG